VSSAAMLAAVTQNPLTLNSCTALTTSRSWVQVFFMAAAGGGVVSEVLNRGEREACARCEGKRRRE